jgi:hypothetical protein
MSSLDASGCHRYRSMRIFVVVVLCALVSLGWSRAIGFSFGPENLDTTIRSADVNYRVSVATDELTPLLHVAYSGPDSKFIPVVEFQPKSSFRNGKLELHAIVAAQPNLTVVRPEMRCVLDDGKELILAGGFPAPGRDWNYVDFRGKLALPWFADPQSVTIGFNFKGPGEVAVRRFVVYPEPHPYGWALAGMLVLALPGVVAIQSAATGRRDRVLLRAVLVLSRSLYTVVTLVGFLGVLVAYPPDRDLVLPVFLAGVVSLIVLFVASAIDPRVTRRRGDASLRSA